jgi:hypothetical protein
MESEKPDATKPKVVHFDTMPKALRAHREGIRSMMQDRCAEPGSPIPLGTANRAADWIMMLTAYRAYRRTVTGRKPFPDAETLKNDIVASAEAVELLFVVAAEEVAAETPLLLPERARRSGSPHLLVPQGVMARHPPLGSAGDDPERGVPRGEPEGPPGDDGPAAA